MTRLGRRRFLEAAGALAAFAAAACSRRQQAPPAAVAKRIVSVSPSTTEALFAVGAGDRVVGRSRFCDYPPEAQKLPVVGGIVDADLEAILGLEPDLVVGSPGPATLRIADKVSAMGIATWFPENDSLAAVDAMLLGMGERTGHAEGARRVVAGMGARIADVERAVGGEAPPRVLVILEASPVVAAGPRTFLDELVGRARATNALSAGAAWQTLGFEQIIESDVDVIVDASVMGLPGAATRITPSAQGWRDVRAVQAGRVAAIADERILRPGPRVAEGLAILARALHPHAAVPSW